MQKHIRFLADEIEEVCACAFCGGGLTEYNWCGTLGDADCYQCPDCNDITLNLEAEDE